MSRRQAAMRRCGCSVATGSDQSRLAGRRVASGVGDSREAFGGVRLTAIHPLVACGKTICPEGHRIWAELRNFAAKASPGRSPLVKASKHSMTE